MSAGRLPELWTESAVVVQPPAARRLHVPEPDAPEAPFNVSSAAGGEYLQDSTEHGLLWSIDAEEPNVLCLLESSQGGQLQEAALQLDFQSALLPHVALDVSEPQPCLYAMTARGFLHAVSLSGGPPQPSAPGQRVGLSRLAAVSPESSITSTDLSAELSRLGAQTAMVAAAGHVCIGGAAGGVTCIPQASLRRGSVEGAFELRDAGGVGRLLTSLFARPAAPAVCSLISIPAGGGRQLLGAAYADASLRLWSVPKQACVLHEALKPDLALAPSRLRYAPPPADEPGRPGKLLVQLDAPSAAAGISQAQSQLVIYELNGTLGADGVSGLSLQQALLFFSHMPLHVGRLEPPPGAAGGPLRDACGQQRAGVKLRGWALGADGGVGAWDDAPVSRGVRGARARMLGADARGLAAADPAQLALQEELWHVVIAEVEARSGGSVAPDLALRHFVTALLPPGGFSVDALSAALEEGLGAGCSAAELRGCSVAELQRRTLQALQERAADEGQFAAVRELLSAYWGAQDAAQPPLALLPPPPGHRSEGTGQAPDIIRGGPSLGALCPAAPAAALAGGCACPGQPVPTQALQHVAAAAGKLGDLLGPYLGSLFSALLQQGFDLHAVLLPALVHALATGPRSDAPPAGRRGGPDAAQLREAGGAWRRARARLALELGALLQPLRSPQEAMLAYAQTLTALPAPSAATGNEAASMPPPTATTAAAAAQLAAGQAAAARDLLLLGAYLGSVRSLGDFALPPAAWHAIQSAALPEAEAALRQAEVARWAAAAPAPRPRPPSGDPAALLRRLQLGRKGAPVQAPAAQLPGGLQQEALLAHSFLRELRKGNAPGGGVAAWGARLAAALLAGGGSEGARTGDVNAQARVGAQVAGLGRALFLDGQLPALLPLLRLAGPAAEEPGLQFLQGYATLDQLRATSDQSERQRIACEAAGPLFRAAAGLGGGMFMDPAAAPAAEGEVIGGALMQELLRALCTEMAGAYEAEGPQARAPCSFPAERLQYYEALMLACERLGCPQLAARFAQAAVRQVDFAYAAGDGATGNAAEQQQEGRSAREGRLWANLFVYSLDAGNTQARAPFSWKPHAAYAAMLANPVPERQLEALQRLLRHLSASGDVAALARLPLAGTIALGGAGSQNRLQKEGGPEMLSLAGEARRFLAQRASHADLSARPQPYQVLYDFCVARCELREAAAAQLALARRLREEAPAALEPLQAALSASLNALALVEPPQAWLEDPAAPDLAPGHQPASASAGTPGFLGSPLLRGPYLPAPASPRSPLPEGLQEDALTEASAQGLHLATAANLGREIALVRAQAAAAAGGAAGCDAATRPSDVLQLLLAQGRFEAALQLAHALYEGAPLARWLQRITSALAAACVRLQQAEHSGASSAGPSGSGGQLSAGQGLFGPAGAGEEMGAAAAWALLRRHLLSESGVERAGLLRCAAVDAVLSADSRLALPAWLLQLFQAEDAGAGMAGSAGDPAALLRLYMRHSRLRDAAQLALRHLHAWRTQVVDVRRQQHLGAWFPHGLLASLQAQLAAAPQLEEMTVQLQAALHAHCCSAGEQSRMLEQRLAAV